MTGLWPYDILKPRDVTRQLRARTTSGTTAASGFTQRVSVPAHAWVIEYAGIVIWTREQLAYWDAIEAGLDGGATPIYVPLVGDAGYLGAPPSPIDGALVGATAAGDTTVTIRRIDWPVTHGDHFTVGDGRLHRVWAVTVTAGDDYTVLIRPPLRDNYVDATAVAFGPWPYCKCRLASDNEMRLTITPGRIAVGAVRFIEDPN